GACCSWPRGACMSGWRAPASDRGAWMSWLFTAVFWASISFAFVTSGGHADCASAIGVKAAKNATLRIVAITLFIPTSFLVSGVCATRSPRRLRDRTDPTSSSLLVCRASILLAHTRGHQEQGRCHGHLERKRSDKSVA